MIPAAAIHLNTRRSVRRPVSYQEAARESASTTKERLRVFVKRQCDRDVKVSRPAWSRDHFFGLGLGFTVIDLGLVLGLMR